MRDSLARRPGFTLVEMLVVMGIIAVLIALLMPAVMMAINAARRARIATEVNSLSQAVESYKQATGDYPPNFRDFNVVLRHIRRAYPKIDQTHLNNFIQTAWGNSYNLSSPPPLTAVPNLDEGESLVFWLYLTDTDPRYPFRAALTANPINGAQSPKHYFPFKEDRLISEDGDQFPSYRAVFSKETFYIYIDSRSYQYFLSDLTQAKYGAYAEQSSGSVTADKTVRPYWSETPNGNSATTPPTWPNYKAQNPTTFQLLCAGQDGDFGGDVDSSGSTPTDAKFVPGGGNFAPADRDNITNFSDGRRLEDLIQN